MFNALLTLIGQLVQPAGYNSDQAGLFGGVLIGAGACVRRFCYRMTNQFILIHPPGPFCAILFVSGIVGAGMAGTVLDATHAYKPVLKTGFCLTGLSVALMLTFLR